METLLYSVTLLLLTVIVLHVLMETLLLLLLLTVIVLHVLMETVLYIADCYSFACIDGNSVTHC